MADELLDLVNKEDEVIGTVLKSAAHKNPALLHRESFIVLITKDRKVLLQQRSMSKKNSPGEWKITAGGHVLAGEDPADAVIRETKEELGIDTQPIYLSKKFAQHKDMEARFYWIYYQIVDHELPFVLQEEEVMDAKWVGIDDLEDFSKNYDYDLESTSHKTIMEIVELVGL